MTHLRIALVASQTGVWALVLALVLGTTALFTHRGAFMIACILCIAVSTAGLGIIETSRTWLGLRLGQWRTLNGKPISRDEMAGRFWRRTVLHGALAAIYLGGAALLAWTFVDLVLKAAR